MKIAIFGLGYVGSVSAACLAAAGHEIIGIDVDAHKLALVREGRSPIREPGLDDLLGRMVGSGRIAVTSDAAVALHTCDLSLVCVGTPSRRNGSLDTRFLEQVIGQIGRALAEAGSYHVVAIRSTVVPGLLQSRLIPLLEQVSGRKSGGDFGVCVNPEFLREGTALRDFERPPFTLIGQLDPHAGDVLLSAYAHLAAPVHRISPDEASMVKYGSNMFHAMKVAFANEIAAVCEQRAVNGHKVMDIFCQDTDLNISPRYLRPGFGFGGSCLPKDLRAFVHLTKELDVSTPLLSNVLTSNDAHIQRLVDAVLDMRQRHVALVGLSFKLGTDDLRESPFVRLAESLIGKGVLLSIYDPDVELGDVFGGNRAYIQEHLPHVAHLVTADFATMIRNADIIILGKRVPEIATLPDLVRSDQTVVDLVGLSEQSAQLGRPLTPFLVANL